MAFDFKTKNGYNMFDISSMLQKAIRRCDIVHASYAVTELAEKYRKYLWKRLLTISAEDCYGIMTKEIIGLLQADEIVNKNCKGEKNDLFLAKAVVLLCMARKNRDADYVACNFMWGDRLLTDEEYEEFVDYKQAQSLELDGIEELPDYVYDVHTLKGRKNGKTQIDMFKEENEALNPRQMNLFDFGDFSGYFDHEKKERYITSNESEKIQSFQKGKKLDPTESGTVWTKELYEKYRMK